MLLCDPDRRSVEPIELAEPGNGVLGMTPSAWGILYVVDRGRPSPDEPERSELRSLDPVTWSDRWTHQFRLGRDVHGVFADGASVYAASTGTDELLRLDLEGDRPERVIWRAGAQVERADTQHVNGVAVAGGAVYVSAFGPRPRADAWAKARSGYVRPVFGEGASIDPVYHPHSVCEISSGEVAVCESPRRRVVTSAGRSSEELPGYARGLCLVEGRMFVGTSRERHVSEPQSILPYEAATDVPLDGGVAAICELDPDELTLRSVIGIDPFGREVYDIISVPV